MKSSRQSKIVTGSWPGCVYANGLVLLWLLRARILFDRTGEDKGHDVRISTFDFMTDVKPVFEILSFLKPQERFLNGRTVDALVLFNLQENPPSNS